MAPTIGIKKKSSKKSISDKISEFLIPKQLHDPEIDSEDETTARNFNEHDDDENIDELRQHSTGKNISLSDIRKKNVKLLNDADEKYRGKVSSRKDFQNSDDEGVSAATIDDFENSSDDETDAKEFSMKLQQFDSDDSEDEGGDYKNNEDDNDVDDDDDDDDDADADDNEMNDNDDKDDDDDDEDEDSLGDDGTDSDESDFNDGDILTQFTNKAELSPTATPSIKPSNISGEIEKGICVQNQLQIWEKLLEIRINSQKLLTKANSLPNFEKINKFQENNDEFSLAMSKTSKNLENLFDKMCEMQHQMIAKYSETKELPLPDRRKRKSTNIDDNNNKNKKFSTFSNELQETYSGYRNYRDSVLLKWHDRTKILNPGSKDSKFTNSLNILQNIEGALANRDELLKKTQLYKGGYQIIGHKQQKSDENNENDKINDDNHQQLTNSSIETPENLYSTEIYDDTDFYHTQLRELIEFKANTSTNSTEMTKQFMELQKLRKKMKKVVDTRASKGRKIRYVVHNKMVNFMARNDPTEWTHDAKTELYSSLFGARMDTSESLSAAI